MRKCVRKEKRIGRTREQGTQTDQREIITDRDVSTESEGVLMGYKKETRGMQARGLKASEGSLFDTGLSQEGQRQGARRLLEQECQRRQVEMVDGIREELIESVIKSKVNAN